MGEMKWLYNIFALFRRKQHQHQLFLSLCLNISVANTIWAMCVCAWMFVYENLKKNIWYIFIGGTFGAGVLNRLFALVPLCKFIYSSPIDFILGIRPKVTKQNVAFATFFVGLLNHQKKVSTFQIEYSNLWLEKFIIIFWNSSVAPGSEFVRLSLYLSNIMLNTFAWMLTNRIKIIYVMIRCLSFNQMLIQTDRYISAATNNNKYDIRQ